MNEAAFPLLGAAFVVLVVLPLCAFLAKAALVFLEREEMGGPLHGLGLRYLLIAGSSLLPLAWLCSAGLHQLESGTSLACLLDHDGQAPCFEPGYFSLTLVLLAAATSIPAWLRVHAVRPAHSAAAVALERRIEEIVGARGALFSLHRRVLVTDEVGFAIGTQGLLKARVYVGIGFAAGLTDSMLAGALAHEAEHVRSFDPLRYLVLRLALAVNPVGRCLLESHAGRWLAAREAHCDREAVIAGAQPLALAEAIVRAARPDLREAVALGARDTVVLEFRVGLLLAFTERTPVQKGHSDPSTFPLACILLLVALLLPHQTGTEALDALHVGAEHAVTLLSP
jgi:hypothetical protein